MNDFITIQNKRLRIKIRLYSGTLYEVTDLDSGEELLWQGDDKSWPDRDIVIFPLIARLKDKYYTVDGRRYDMDIHGLAYYSDFTPVSISGDKAVIRLVSSAETLKKYPFPFELTVSYALKGNSLVTSYNVKNIGDKIMPFCLGGHAGYKLDCTESANGTDTSGNFLVLDNKQALIRYRFTRDCFVINSDPIGSFDRFEIKKELFKDDAVVLDKILGGVTLIRKNGIKIHFDIGDPPVFAFWSHARYGGYVCIEPWWGLPDTQPATRELSDKPLMNFLSPNDEFNRSITATLL